MTRSDIDKYLDPRDVEIRYTQRMQHKMGLEKTGHSNTVKIHYLCFQNDLLNLIRVQH